MSTPLHPLLVHFPIALLILGGVVQILAFWKKEPFDKLATFLIGVGFLSGIVAYMTGEPGIPFARQYLTSNLRPMIRPHETYAMLSLLTFAILLGFKLIPKIRLSKLFLPVVLLLSLAGISFISITGHYGGQIVYQSQITSPANPVPNSTSMLNNK